MSAVVPSSAEVEGGEVEVAALRAFRSLARTTVNGHGPLLQDMAATSDALDELVVLLFCPRKMALEVYRQLIPLLRAAVKGIHQRPGIALGSHVEVGQRGRTAANDLEPAQGMVDVFMALPEEPQQVVRRALLALVAEWREGLRQDQQQQLEPCELVCASAVARVHDGSVAELDIRNLPCQ